MVNAPVRDHKATRFGLNESEAVVNLVRSCSRDLEHRVPSQLAESIGRLPPNCISEFQASPRFPKKG
jgi:hypothetical protein